MDKEQIYGNWQINTFENYTQGIDKMFIEDAKAEALSSFYNFGKDNTFSLKSKSFPQGDVGNWTLDEENILKVTHNIGGREANNVYHIIQLNSNEMIWKRDLGKQGKVIFSLSR